MALSLSRFADLLFVPTCVGCGERLRHGFLCPMCEIAYTESLSEVCQNCCKVYSECRCVPPLLRKAGIREHYKIYRYDPAFPENAESRMLYTLKHKKNRVLVDFLASEMAGILQNFRADADTVMTFLPRTRRAVLNDGFDQSRLLGKSVSALLRIPFLKVLKNTSDKTQKSLTAEERILNVSTHYKLVKAEAVKGKRVLLLDDVATTGASLAAGAKLLRRAGAVNVTAVTVAVTHRSFF